MIQAFDEGIDLHRMTGGLVFGKSWQEVSDEPGSTTLGGGEYSERDFGKKANHSLNYDFGAPSFALKYEITVKDAKWIVDRYHQVYPEIRGVYHKSIKDQLMKDRTLTNLLGRKRTFYGAWEDSLFKTAYAHIPQSTVADYIDKYAINFIWDNRHLWPELQLMIQVHDSVGFQLPLSVGWERHAEIILAIHSYMTTPMSWNEREFTGPADLTMGLTLNKRTGRDIKDHKLPRDPAKLALTLAEKYKELTNAGE
jgi:DNA polymerase I-like protein with 3'-5' exonuclease and polymerase domains